MNPEQWQLLDKEVFPALIKKFGKNLKIWSAACSTGDEPYSLVMALSKHLPLNQIKITATDMTSSGVRIFQQIMLLKLHLAFNLIGNLVRISNLGKIFLLKFRGNRKYRADYEL